VSSPNAFPVAGIGASAGGLQALESLFRGLPPDTGIAFIIVTHLPRDRESALPDILGRYTKMPVATAVNGEAVEPNHVYCCPPDYILSIRDRKLRLSARTSEAQFKPIDVFLGSLSEDSGVAAIGILLSGSGTDGTLGIKSIKERGGFTVAQGHDGTGPAYSDMPNAAVAAEVVDLVVPADQMGSRLADYAARFDHIEEAAESTEPEAENGYTAIYQILLKQVGHDFSGYKQRTFQRRVRRRMQVTQIDNLEGYVERLRADPKEVSLLFRDLLIGVTNFFRDKDAFEILEREVIPRLFEAKGANDHIRIWVPGCATGEEVYSIAILVREHMDKVRNAPKVQIFATDIDETALAVARAGRYPAPLMDNVAPERLKRFFTGDDASYAVAKDIRDMCVFSPHSVLRDPPFSRIDLISCRNLLIYLGTDFQSQVIPVFHFALRPRGYLFLGTSENVSQHSDLFTPVDKKQRIFQRREHSITTLNLPSVGVTHGRRTPTGLDLRREPANVQVNLRRMVETWVMDRFAPAHVVVDHEGDIVHYSPRTGKYLEPASGLPSRQLLAMARKGLRLDLRAAFREAVEARRHTERRDIAIEIDDRIQKVDLVVEPLGGVADSDPLFLVLFRDVGEPFAPSEADHLSVADDSGGHVERLEQELRDTRERLQATVEEYETAVEELKSSNEELQSVNEELQSTNEELETSKEELQSLNEELHTVNSELTAKVEEVDRAHADLRNIFESTRIATVFLDKHLGIRSFTPAVTEIFNLISTDRGRPLTDIASHLEDVDLRRDVQTVFERGEVIERNVRRADGKTHYLMRILPYRGYNNHIEGVLVTFVEVTKMVEAEAHQRTLVEELNHRVRNMLAVVNAVATQTLRQSRSPERFVESFTGRIRAMGAAYSLVSSQNWNQVPLLDLLKQQFQPFQLQNSDRVHLQGADYSFVPTAALSLSLVMHELVTNAVKYGALSSAGGHVNVEWAKREMSAPALEITWREEGGPPAKKPKQRGFGSELIEREVKGTLAGNVAFDYGANGIAVTIVVPFERNVSGPGH
jgi:two-component system, chemotaxis family, CheB/CheR fusion protein